MVKNVRTRRLCAMTPSVHGVFAIGLYRVRAHAPPQARIRTWYEAEPGWSKENSPTYRLPWFGT
jgi:hypothetical protein